MCPRPVDMSITLLTILDKEEIMAQDVRYAVALTTSWQADLVFIIVNHDEVVRTAEQHGSGDSSLFSNAMGFVSDNQVFISCTPKGTFLSQYEYILYF